MSRIGFTGTREGMTENQRNLLEELLRDFASRHGISEFHSGDCVGADTEAYWIVKKCCNAKTIGHIPKNSSQRSFLPYDKEETPSEYLQRNRNIVDSSDFLIAGPSGPETVRSGTWATVRYANKKGKKVYILPL